MTKLDEPDAETPDEPDDFPAPDDLADDDARLDEPDETPDEPEIESTPDDFGDNVADVPHHLEAPRPPVELVISTGGRRVYRVGDDYYPSVTTLLRAVAKPALPSWAARSVAEWVAANLDTVTVLGAGDSAGLVDLLKGVPWRIRDDAAARGSEAHRLIAAGVRAESRPDDDKLRPLLEHYEQWLVDSGATVLAAELPVASAHYGWAGTIDAVVELGNEIGLVDLKTSRAVVDRDGRLYPEMPLQLAAYAACEIGHDFDISFGSVLHLSVDGCTEHRAFVSGSSAAHWLAGVPTLDELVAVMQAVKTLADHLGMGATL